MKRTRKISNKASIRLHPALENLKERLSSPRLKAASTISTYLETSAKFLSRLGKDREPTDSDFRRYFIQRRRQGISERTLRKEFFHLKKLAMANGWEWPFQGEGTSAIVPPRKTGGKTLTAPVNAVDKLHPALQNLVERLSSPRPRAQSTLSSYLTTGANSLSGLKDGQSPTESDFRQYFIRRRREEVSERTLRKEFSHLKKLAAANGWEWPFGADEAPYPEEGQKPPTLSQRELEQLIRAKSNLYKAERFYLAVATTWLVRREELSRIKKRDYDGETFIFHTAEQGKEAKHLIPDALKPIFADYRPKVHSGSALSTMFRRICVKAGLEHKKGLGWDSIRYRLNTLLKEVCSSQERLSSSFVDDYAEGKGKVSVRHGRSDMTEDYRHPEILDTDPFGLDKVIYSIHLFLPLWREKELSKLTT